MLIFKKNFLIQLYILFFFLFLIIFEFSTNYAYGNIYHINKVNIVEKYDLKFDKQKIIDKAFREAFKILIYKIVDKKDRYIINNTDINIIKSLIESFEITDEKFVNNNYKSQFNVEFNKKKTLRYVEDKNIISSIPKEIKIIIIPILIDLEKNQINYFNENVFFKNWNKVTDNYFLLKYILPNQDIEDYSIIKKNLINIENYNFEEIIRKYNVNNYIILLMFKNDDELKILSKLQFEKKKMIQNKIFKNFNINNDVAIKDIILEMKESYEDKWKSINKLNTSIALTIRISLDSKNIKLSKNIEKTLLKIDLISDFKIDKFDNQKVIYKIIFNSSPDRFLEIMNSYNFIIDTSKELWEIK